MAKPQNDFSSDAFQEAGRALAQLGRMLDGATYAGMVITGLSIRGPRMPGDETLIVIRAYDAEEAPWVAFHSAYTLIDAVRGAVARLMNGTMKWKPDDYRK